MWKTALHRNLPPPIGVGELLIVITNTITITITIDATSIITNNIKNMRFSLL
jgi:hypothetical protein